MFQNFAIENYIQMRKFLISVFFKKFSVYNTSQKIQDWDKMSHFNNSPYKYLTLFYLQLLGPQPCQTVHQHEAEDKEMNWSTEP